MVKFSLDLGGDGALFPFDSTRGYLTAIRQVLYSLFRKV
jgi:hypothetical protein